jgi:hypothetical protein
MSLHSPHCQNNKRKQGLIYYTRFRRLINKLQLVLLKIHPRFLIKQFKKNRGKEKKKKKTGTTKGLFGKNFQNPFYFLNAS